MNAKKPSCCGSITTGKRIMMLSLGLVGLTVVALFFVKNPFVSLSLLAIPPLLLCPIACGAFGGLLWFVARPSKSRELNDK